MIPPKARTQRGATRPVLYQLCRAGDRFEVGDGPTDLSGVEVWLLGRGEAPCRRSAQGSLLVDDPWMSSKHAQLLCSPDASSGARVVIEDLNSRNGVLVNGERASRASLQPGDLVETGRTFWLYLEEPVEMLLLDEPAEFGTWTTWNPRLAADLKRLEREADGKQHLFLSGPEGTGKGFLARTLHLTSGRAGRLVHLDCRERSAQRLEVDLFGGEGQRARLQDAHLGTLFLEHCEALPLALQDRLVAALTSGAFELPGTSRWIPADVRLVMSSTHRLEEAVARGKLRPAFVDALSALVVSLPGLEERRADLGLLLDDFLARARGAQAISRDACRAVLLHRWRMHVKAFARVIESAAVLAADVDEHGRRSGLIDLAHLPLEVVDPSALSSGTRQDSPEGSLAPPRAHGAGAIAPDPERTDDTGVPTLSELAGHAQARSRAQAADAVEGFEAFDETDPGAQPTAGRPPPASSWERATSEDERAKSTSRAHAAASGSPRMERSYAAAIDPERIVDALRRSRGNVSAAARYLGKPRALVLRWMREFGIRAEHYR